MNLTTVNPDMSRGAARQAFLEYRHAVQESIDKEASYSLGRIERERLERQREADEAIMAGYKQLAMGKQVISVRDTISSGGLDTSGRPKIAVANAAIERVRVRVYQEGGVKFDDPNRFHNARSAARIEFPDRTFPGDQARPWDGKGGTAIVPSIPPHLRPTISIDKFWVLFEAEYLKPPVDPALLRPIGGGLAVVVATWNLTTLEQAVLGMTR